MQEVFFNYSFNKNKLKSLLLWCMANFGQNSMINLAENLKLFGFDYATRAGISLGIDDLRTIPTKYNFIYKSSKNSNLMQQYYELGIISEIQKSEYFIENWQKISEILKKDISQKFKTINKLNPIYMMAFSGARGNISQVRQLIGMRGLMADPNGQIIHLPITSNFREGLTVTEYLISCYGARKGVVDTALRTATAGYLTRRLVDTAQHVIISQLDCMTRKGIFLSNLYKNRKIILPIKNQLYGRILGKDFILPEIDKRFYRNQQIDESVTNFLANQVDKVYVRSSLKCQAPNLTLCQLCYGWNLSHSRLISLGEVVGIIAAQSIGEPGTQLTMRTFHTGGVFSGTVISSIYAPFDGIVIYSSSLSGNLLESYNGQATFVVKKKGFIILSPLTNKISKRIKLLAFTNLQNKAKFLSKKFEALPYTTLFIKNNEKVKFNQLIAKKSEITSSDQQIEASYVVSSKIQGEIVLKDCNSFRYLKTLKQKKNMWILYGKIYKSLFPIKSTLKIGDYIEYKHPLVQIRLLNTSSSFLRAFLVQKNLKFDLPKCISQSELLMVTENPIFSLNLKNFFRLNDLYFFDLNLTKNIETENTVRVSSIFDKPHGLYINKIQFEKKNVNILRIKKRNFKHQNLFIKYLKFDNFNENCFETFKFNSMNWLTPNFCANSNIKILKVNNFNENPDLGNLNYFKLIKSKNLPLLRDNLYMLKEKTINLFGQTLDSFSLCISNKLFPYKINILNKNLSFFLYPPTSLRYIMNGYLKNVFGYCQKEYDMNHSKLIRMRIRSKAQSCYNNVFLYKKYNTIFYKDFINNLFLNILIWSLIFFALLSLLKKNINNMYLFFLQLSTNNNDYKFELKCANLFLIDLLLFLNYFKKISNIKIYYKLNLIGHFITDIFNRFILLKNSFVTIINDNKLKKVINVTLLKLSNKTYLFSLVFLMKINYQLNLNPSFFIKNFTQNSKLININIKEQNFLNFSTPVLFLQAFNVKFLGGWITCLHYQQYKKDLTFNNNYIYFENTKIPSLLKEFNSFHERLKFWNLFERKIVNKYFLLQQYRQQPSLSKILFFVSRKKSVFYTFIPFQYYSKKFIKKKFLFINLFTKCLKLNISKIILKLCSTFYFIIKNVENPLIYYNQNIDHLFINYGHSLSNTLMNYRFKDPYYTNLSTNSFNKFYQLDSSLFNKQRKTKLNLSGFYKKINISFKIKIPLLKNTYLYKSNYKIEFNVTNKLFFLNQYQILNYISRNNYYGNILKRYQTNNKLKIINKYIQNVTSYLNCSLIHKFFHRSLNKKNINLWIKEKITFSINHLNWLPRWFSIAKIKLFSPYEGQIIAQKFLKYSNNLNINNQLMILTNLDIACFSLLVRKNQSNLLQKNLFWNQYFVNKSSKIKFYSFPGSLIKSFFMISPGKKLCYSGKIITLMNDYIMLRKGKPFQFSIFGIFYIWDGDFINIDSPIMTLIYSKLKTGDIVQGIPKIEHFFEARKSIKELNRSIKNSLYLKLNAMFIRLKKKLSLDRAIRRSLAKIQKVIIDGILRVYCSQGIIISRKHFEIIVKQMTSKAKVIDGGQTGLLEGELVEISKIEKINKMLFSKQIIYEPLILGITKTSLKTESFISSASFQETIKVLSQSSLERKIDFLNGLKENVILSKLIPGGTGLIIRLKLL